MGGKSGGSSGQITGYRYFFGILMGLCRGPIDELVLISSDGRVAWDGEKVPPPVNPQIAAPAFSHIDDLGNPVYFPPGEVKPPSPDFKVGTITENYLGARIDAVGLYGGDAKEGGLEGDFDVLMGRPDQVMPARVQGAIGQPTPGFRGVVTIYYDGLVCANNPYPKAWRFRVRRSQKWSDRPGNTAWYAEKATIVLSDLTVVLPERAQPEIRAMNPAHILYECVTNRDWGRGLQESVIDQGAFLYAANLLFDEGFGICMKWSRTDGLDNFIQAVLDHIGGALFVDRITGLITLTLIREDYEVDELSTFDYSSGLIAINISDQSAQDNSPNEIIVKYYSPVLDQQRSVRAHNLAAIQSARATFSMTKDYLGIPTPDLAARVAVRDLKAMSSGLKRYELTVDRRGYQIQPGAVFKITDPERGLQGLVLRAVLIRDAASGAGALTITAVADVFGLPTTTYYEPQTSTFKLPDRQARPAQHRLAFNPSWRDVYRSRGDEQPMRPDDSVTAGLGFMAQSPTPQHQGFYLFTQRGAENYVNHGRRPFAPLGALTKDITSYEQFIELVGTINPMNCPANSALLIDDGLGGKQEIVWLFGYVSASKVEIRRGCVDTLPKPHLAGSRVWGLDMGIVTDAVGYVQGETVNVIAGTFTTGDTLNAALAPIDNLTLIARHHKPYSASGLTLNGVRVDEIGTLTGNLVFTWNHRNRITQMDYLIDHEVASVAPEPGTLYDIRLKRPDGSDLRVFTTDQNTFTYTEAMTLADMVHGNYMLMVETRRNGIAALEKYVRMFRYEHAKGPFRYGSDFGMDFGSMRN